MHEMSNLFFGTYMYQKKILLNAVCCNFTQSAKHSVFFFFFFYIISPYLFYLMDQSEKSVIISRVHCKEKKSYGLVFLGDG